ncbi:LacI family DNA-binding transcriptional regulator [Stutzerimonas nitrititolerans]|uniref:LacI family DNA-binding transcriptional regulator n=1 Tax=Stutzerimonas nitrititolerans TaxID=2482751 RepID=UPI0028A63D4E|nr:LacI family DNA-binding transcriptional regulator [Stutzerimonas nitrititolerans]
MPNIRKVAELAGVSVATVSRTLRTPERVSPQTRDRVHSAVEQAGYRPNLMAVQFRSRKTRNLVVLVPVIANVFFARVISGIQEAAQSFNYRVLLCDTRGREEVETAYAELVHAHQADGVIQLRAFNPFGKTCRHGDSLPPMVNACEVLDAPPCPSVRLDNRAAARAMTEHLLALGHRRIGLIKGPQGSPLTRERIAGYEDALREAGIVPDPELLCRGNFTLQAGYEAAGLLMRCADRPTAIFCENDEMAIGAIQRIRQCGLRVPQDVSVAGFDDIPFAAFCDPPLTTIAQPAEAFGRHAVEMLVAQFEQHPLDTPHLILPYSLVVRGSTAAAHRCPA